MARTATSETLASHVYAALRSGILNGEFEPGQKLRPAELRERYGVSVSVIREALARLAEQHLVRGENNQGFRVTPLTEKELLDLTAIRVVVDGYALRVSIERGDLAWESRLVAAGHLLAVTPSRDAPGIPRVTEAWSEAHRAFHRTLTEACQMPMMTGMCDSLLDASELYRRLSAPFTAEHRDVAAEHQRILDATLARDADLAVEHLSAHYQLTTALLLEGLLHRPGHEALPGGVDTAQGPQPELDAAARTGPRTRTTTPARNRKDEHDQ